MRSIAEALASMLPAFSPLGEEDVYLTASSGRYLSRDLLARLDSPPFDNSAMDGYAVRASEVASAEPDAPVRLPVRGESRAGGPLPGALEPGTTYRIFTGAPMPAGATLVKKMLLKDNDCGGPLKTNVVKNAGLIDQLRHMNAKMYANVRWLAAGFARGQEAPKFFVSEALFGQRDIDMLRANLGTLSNKLHDACTSGKLLLDLDLEAHLAGQGHDPASCEASAPAQ